MKYWLLWKRKDKDDDMTEMTLSMKSKSDVSDKFDLSEALFLGFFKASFSIRFYNQYIDTMKLLRFATSASDRVLWKKMFLIRNIELC